MLSWHILRLPQSSYPQNQAAMSHVGPSFAYCVKNVFSLYHVLHYTLLLKYAL